MDNDEKMEKALKYQTTFGRLIPVLSVIFMIISTSLVKGSQVLILIFLFLSVALIFICNYLLDYFVYKYIRKLYKK